LYVNCNYTYNNFSFKLHNDGVTDTVFNIRQEFFTVVKKIWAHVKVNVPANDNDINYSVDFFKTSVDAEKFLKGVKGNYVLKVYADAFFNSADRKIEFPLQKVKTNFQMSET
jgi:hypothetical protein